MPMHEQLDVEGVSAEHVGAVSMPVGGDRLVAVEERVGYAGDALVGFHLDEGDVAPVGVPIVMGVTLVILICRLPFWMCAGYGCGGLARIA